MTEGYLNIAAYQFIPLTNLTHLQSQLLSEAKACALKGTILLSEEGINLSLAGESGAVRRFQRYLASQQLLMGSRFHETYSKTLPFQRLKVKLKREIITFRQSNLPVTEQRAPALSPQALKTWLDEKRDFTFLDTRNEYEVRWGTFAGAKHLPIDDFSALPEAMLNAESELLDKQKPVVMFCTGGVRCEKAAFYLQAQGYTEVYQVDGGILGYFAEVGGAHYDGDCFVFDERLALTPALRPTHQSPCPHCQGPLADLHTHRCAMSSAPKNNE